MPRHVRALYHGLLMAALLGIAGPSHAQIEDQLSAYTGVNAKGYLQPLVDAFGANLNDALFHSAEIPTVGLRLKLEFQLMTVMFRDKDRTFTASTESGFQPPMTVEAPTVVGSGDALVIDGNAGTSFAFPGGFDLNSFSILVPQLRFGAVAGTEALVRFFALNTGEADLGDIVLFGLGIRHSISQYLGPAPPLDLAVGVFWQKFKMGDHLIDTDAFSVGVHGSRRFSLLEPYAGLSLDTFSLDAEYDYESGGTTEQIKLDFDRNTTTHLTLGLNVNLAFLDMYAEYNIADPIGRLGKLFRARGVRQRADQNSFALGFGVGK